MPTRWWLPVRGLRVDPVMGDPVAAQLIAAAGKGDWRGVHTVLSGVDEPDTRTFHIRRVAEVRGVHRWVDRWVAAEPRSALPLLVKGAHATVRAWDARGTGLRHTVGPDAAAIFHERLLLAEGCLTEASLRDTDDAIAWAFLVRVARGLTRGVDETRRRFDEARRRHPWHLEAHDQMLQQLCRKWGGSHRRMFDFARQTVADMPAGSPLGRLVAAAHIERWHDAEGDDTYVTLPAARADLDSAADRSVRHPEHVRGPGWPVTDNTFAAAFCLSKEWGAARTRFQVIGRHVTEYPWTYLEGSATEAFNHFRKLCRVPLP